METSLETTSTTPSETTSEGASDVQKRRNTWKERQQLSLFWSWNLIFLAFMSLGFAPVILPEIMLAARTGTIPVSFLIYAVVLASIPVAAVILGLTVLRGSPGRLFALGYVVEGPLMLLLAVRFFVIRQAANGTLALMAIALLGMAAFLWTQLDRRAGERRSLTEAARLAGLTLMVLTSLYAAVWIAFYAVPGSALAWREFSDVFGQWIRNIPRNIFSFFEDIFVFFTHLPGSWRLLVRSLQEFFRSGLVMLPFQLLGTVLLVYTSTLVILTPLAVPFLSVAAWLRCLKQQAARWGWAMTAVLLVAVIAVTTVAFSLANRQPQGQVFALLEKPPQTMDEAQSLLARSEEIRKGLLNVYLAPFRYISADGEVVHVRWLYKDAFRMTEKEAFAVQRLYERVARPLLYKPVYAPDANKPADNRALVQEPHEAARLYQQFFDMPIAVAERPAIVQAVRSTWSSDIAEAAWQAVDDREVRLVSQEITLQEHGDWAELELHESYQNQTLEQQEVIYYFNLPESAVLTGVWLGDRPEKDAAYVYQVAPRGAAQEVYREQVLRSKMDPALLEQIGPRQYRLRVFPIPNMRMSDPNGAGQAALEEAPFVHLWVAWRQTADGGAWQMPRLAYLRNVYWDIRTDRLVNGEQVPGDSQEWLPETLPASAAPNPVVHQVDLPDGQTVLAVPAGQVDLPSLPEGLRLGIVLDRSLSMQDYASEVTAALQRLRELPGLGAPVDVYLTASPFRGEEASVTTLDAMAPEALLYFGGQNSVALVEQFDALYQANGQKAYDAVFVITDGSGYDLEVGNASVTAPHFPVWLVHMSGEIPLGYDDGTLEVIQASGGGVTSSLEEALQRLAFALDGANHPELESQPVIDLVDGYVWSILPAGLAAEAVPAGAQVQVHAADDPFTALAARRLILAESQRQQGKIDQVEKLDALHALAVQHGIVTPYSSMIVLVNSQQQAQLDRLSIFGDRFNREVEGLGDTASVTPLVGVPEPHEWLLLGLTTALLIYMAVKKRPELAWARAWADQYLGR